MRTHVRGILRGTKKKKKDFRVTAVRSFFFVDRRYETIAVSRKEKKEETKKKKNYRPNGFVHDRVLILIFI